VASTNPDELLTVAEVATELKVTEATVRRWINQDKLRARRLAGGDFRIVRGDLNTILGIEPDPPAREPAKRPFAMTAGRMTVK